MLGMALQIERTCFRHSSWSWNKFNSGKVDFLFLVWFTPNLKTYRCMERLNV